MGKKRIFKTISILLALVLLVELVIIVFNIRQEQVYARNLDLGNKYLLEADYDSAITAFSEAIKIKPMSSDAYIKRGDAYRELGNYELAKADYQQAGDLTGDYSKYNELMEELSPTPTPEPSLTPTPTPSPAAAAIDPEEIYKDQLTAYRSEYEKHRNGENPDENADINVHAIIHPIGDALGYSFLDLSDDGVPELVIASIDGQSYYAWDIFAYDGTSVHRINEAGNYRDEELRILEGNYIEEGTFLSVGDEVKVYRLAPNTSEKIMVYYLSDMRNEILIQPDEGEASRPGTEEEYEQLMSRINDTPALKAIEWKYF